MSIIIDADAARLAGLQIDLLQKVRQGQRTLDHIDWFNNLSKEDCDQLMNGKALSYFRETGELRIEIPALPRPTLKKLQGKYSIKSIESDDSPTEPVTLVLGTVLRSGEDSINGDEYEYRLKSIDGKFGYQQGLWLVEHQDEYPEFKKLAGKIYIDLPGLIVLRGGGHRRFPCLAGIGERWGLHWRWIDDDLYSHDRLARSGNWQRLIVGFVCQLLQPSAEHSPDFIKFSRKEDILFRVECFCLPSDLEHKFEEVQLRRPLSYFENPLVWRNVGGRENAIDCFQKQRVDFRAQGVPGSFRDVRHEFVPQLVGIDELPDNRQFVPSGGVKGGLFCINLCLRK